MPKLKLLSLRCHQEHLAIYQQLQKDADSQYWATIPKMCDARAHGDLSLFSSLRNQARHLLGRVIGMQNAICAAKFCIAMGYPSGHIFPLTQAQPRSETAYQTWERTKCPRQLNLAEMYAKIEADCRRHMAFHAPAKRMQRRPASAFRMSASHGRAMRGFGVDPAASNVSTATAVGIGAVALVAGVVIGRSM